MIDQHLMCASLTNCDIASAKSRS